MKSNFERLKFAAEFLELPLEKLLPSEQLGLRENLIRFVGQEIGPLMKVGEEIPIVRGTKKAAKIMHFPTFPGETLIQTVTPQTHFVIDLPQLHLPIIPIDRLQELQKQMRLILERFVDWDRIYASGKVPSFGREIKAWHSVSPISNRLIEEVTFLSGDHTQDLIDGFITILFYLLTHTKAWIRKCPARLSSKDENTKCEKIFVCRDIRKTYCSNTCGTRVRMIRDRKDDTAETRTAKNKARLIREVKALKEPLNKPPSKKK